MLLLGGLMLATAACEEEEPVNYAPTVTTGQATDVYRKGAFLSGSIQNPNGATIKEYGIMVSEYESMAEPTEYRMMDSQSLQTFTLEAAGLTPKKEYFYCAYASSGASTVKGQVKSFTTPESNAPVFGEVKLSGLGAQSVTVASLIQDDGGSDILMHGFCWKLVGENEDAPTVKDNVVNVEIGPKEISATVSGLMPEQEYLVCPYGVNSSGVGYGRTVKFSTQSASAPVLTDIQAVDSTDLSYTVKAVIGDKGKSTITRIGFCWSAENKLPTVEDLHCELPEQLGASSFQYTIDTLSYMTTYYIRAYAENEHGVSYSDVLEFTTKEATLSFIPKEVSDITSRSAHLQTEVILEGETAPQRVGYCVSMEQLDDLTLETTKFFVDAIWNENQIECRIVGLASETQYFVRPFFVNALGKVYYGEMLTFTTGPQGIYNLEDLMAFRDARNAGENVALWKNSNGVINIYADIDLSSITNWEPIVRIETDEIVEGNNYTLNGLSHTQEYIDDWGLVSENNGIIRDLNVNAIVKIEKASSSGHSSGVVACNSTNMIYNCNVTINAYYPYNMGGVVRYNTGTVEKCTVKGTIEGSMYAGGICDVSVGTVKDCINYSNLSHTENWYTGCAALAGIVCQLGAEGKVISCTNEGDVLSTNHYSHLGGIVGCQNGDSEISDCINKGRVADETASFAGGIVGDGILHEDNDGTTVIRTIRNCTNYGTIIGQIAGNICGGFSGPHSSLKDCTYGGIVNGEPGTEANAIGYDKRKEQRVPGIYSLEDLVAFRDAVNNYKGEEYLSYWKNDYGIVNIFADIDMGSIDNWEPIESTTACIIEGNGHTLSNINYTQSLEDNRWGFVRYNSGVIRNLNISANINIKEDDAFNGIGIVTYYNQGQIYNCHTTVMGQVSGYSFGGITHDNYENAVVEKCTSNGQMLLGGCSGAGICEVNMPGGIIKGCSNFCDLTDGWDAAGIVAINYGQVVDCMNEGDLNTDQEAIEFGGIIARSCSGSEILKCVNKGNIAGTKVWYVGGIVGNGSCDSGSITITDCTNIGNITGGPYGGAGNICGYFNGTNFTLTGCTYGGTVNGYPGTEANAIGYDARYE